MLQAFAFMQTVQSHCTLASPAQTDIQALSHNLLSIATTAPCHESHVMVYVYCFVCGSNDFTTLSAGCTAKSDVHSGLSSKHCH